MMDRSSCHISNTPMRYSCVDYSRADISVIMLMRQPEIRLSITGWLGSRVVSVLDSGAVGPGFKSKSRHCRVTV